MDKLNPEDEHRREDRSEAVLIGCSAILMLCGLAFLIAAAWLERQERIERDAKVGTSIERSGMAASPRPAVEDVSPISE